MHVSPITSKYCGNITTHHPQPGSNLKIKTSNLRLDIFELLYTDWLQLILCTNPTWPYPQKILATPLIGMRRMYKLGYYNFSHAP